MRQLQLFDTRDAGQLPGVASTSEVDRLLLWYNPVAIFSA